MHRETTSPTTAVAPESGVLNAVAAVLYLLYIVFTAVEHYARGVVQIPELIGAILGPIIITIIVIAIIRLFKRATTPRGATKVAVVMLALFSLGSLGGVLESVTAQQRAPAEAAARLARGAINAAGNFPKKVDNITMLNGMEARDDTLVYHFQLQMTPLEWRQSSVYAFRQQLITRLCGDAQLRTQSVMQGVVIRYHYTNMYNGELTSIYVTKAVCENADGIARA